MQNKVQITSFILLISIMTLLVTGFIILYSYNFILGQPLTYDTDLNVFMSAFVVIQYLWI